MKAFGNLRKGKKAISTIIGTLFFIIIIFSSFTTLFFVVYTMNQVDIARHKEDIQITDIRFGKTKRYDGPPFYVTTATSPPPGGPYYPAAGTYDYTPSSATLLGGTTVYSGTYSDLASQDGVRFTLNSYTLALTATTEFGLTRGTRVSGTYVDTQTDNNVGEIFMESFVALGDYRLDINTTMLWDKNLDPIADVTGFRIVFKYQASATDDTWYIRLWDFSASAWRDTGFSVNGFKPASPLTWYTVNIDVTSNIGNYIRSDGKIFIEICCNGVYTNGSVTDGSLTLLYVDYLAISYSVSDWYGSFSIGGSASVTQLNVSYTGNYNIADVKQRLFAYNFTLSAWKQIDSATVGTSDNPRAIQITYYIPDLVSGTGEVRIRIRGVKYAITSFRCGADYLHLKSSVLQVTEITSQSTAGYNYPLVNMNFTTTNDGWFLTKTYPAGVYLGCSGGWTPESRGAGSASGPGFIYTCVNYNPPSGTRFFQANWTTSFYIDHSKTGAITDVRFSWGRLVSYNLFLYGLESAIIYVHLIQPDGTVRQIPIPTVGGGPSNTIRYTTAGDNGWQYQYGVSVNSAWFTSDGTYRLIIRSDVTRSYTTTYDEFVIFFDDVGIQLTGAGSSVVDWYATFKLDEDPYSVGAITIIYTSRYDTSVTQHVYIYDYTAKAWALLGVSRVSTSSVTVTYDVAVAVGGGVLSDVQKYICFKSAVYPPATIPSVPGEVRVRVYVSNPTSFTAYNEYVGLEDFWATTSYISVKLANRGYLTANITALWIIDSTGHTRFPLNILLSPGETIVLSEQHTWGPGGYTVRIVTERGNLAVVSRVSG